MTPLKELGYSNDSHLSPNYNTSNDFGLPPSSRSSRQFKSVSRKDPCPICGKDHGCSRTHDEAVLCRREPGVFGETLNGFKCISERGGKEHSVWRPSDQWREGRQYQPQYVKKDPAKEATEYSAFERDSLNRSILDQLTLDPRHKQDLLDRVLSEDAIEKYKFRSVEPYQKVDLDLPGDFPSGSGNKLRVFYKGLLIPIFDVNGFIAGYQYRPDNPGTGGKYRMLSSQESPIRMKGEVPITVIKRSDEEFYHTAFITEGSLKPIVASDRHDLELVIGMLVFSPNLLAETLLKLRVRQVILTPDAGDVLNGSVMNKWTKVIELVKTLGIECHILWYGQTTKDDNDIDEIPSLEGTRFISPDEFLLKAPNRKYDPEFRQEFTPTMTVDKVIIPRSRIVHIRAGMGTGKTQACLEEALEHVKNGGRVVGIGHRNSLLAQTIERASEMGLHIHHVLDDPLLARDSGSNLACCIDSLYRIVGTIDDNTLIIIDETQGFLEHTRTNRNSRELERVLTLALRNCGRIITMDANLTDLAADTIDGLSKKGKSERVLVTIPGLKYPVLIKDGISDEIRKMMEAGEPIIISTDSKKYANVMEKCAIAWGVPTEKILKVTSETIKVEKAKKFMSDPDGEVLRNQYTVVIYSPSCESGLSIQLKGYFKCVFGRFVGVIPVEIPSQMLSRLRDPVPRILECDVRGVNAQDDETIQGKQSRLQAEWKELSSMIREGDENNFDAIVQYTINSGKIFMRYDSVTDFLTSTAKCQYKQNVITHLREQGFDVEINEDPDPSQEEVKLIRRNYDLEQAQKLREATPYESIQEATSIRYPNAEQNLRIQKTFYENTNPGLVESCSDESLKELMNSRQAFRGLNRYVEVVQSTEGFSASVTNEMSQTMSATDLLRSKKSDVIKSIAYKLRDEIDALIRKDKYCYNTPEAQRLLEAAKPHALALGIKPKYSPNQSINAILGHLGYKTELVERVEVEGKRIRFYKVEKALSQELHYKVVRTKMAVLGSSPTESESGPPPLNSYIKDISRGGVAQTESVPTPQLESGPPPLDSYIKDISRGGVAQTENVPTPLPEVGPSVSTGRGRHRDQPLSGKVRRNNPLENGKLPKHLTGLDIRYKGGEFILQDAFNDGETIDTYLRGKSIDDWGSYLNEGCTIIVSVYFGDAESLFTVKGPNQFTPVVNWFKGKMTPN